MPSLPTSEELRRAALSASWRRDHTVRRRRLAWRWTAWACTRWGVPVMLCLALGPQVRLEPAGSYSLLPGEAPANPPLHLSRALGTAPMARPTPSTEPAEPGITLLLAPRSPIIKKEKNP
ncbi:MAG TPA: hypothetical protein VHA82_00775 [Ramlibacter sp.]|uniref:hypothetical protein n=1 Tax=Ramlibacter sp. TaxID=1917967 RepID=UPI002BBFD232|nr:hypothetical protein [Ramlibacter sp.]HVZ42313.1 hypothetical protein [Ramlibacter sp.]